jgi:hypothetical protein
MTTVLLLNTYFSSRTKIPPGNVPKGPVNSANVTKVPNSASKRSRRGVRAMMLKSRWSQLRCIRGKALRRCTTGGHMLAPFYCSKTIEQTLEDLIFEVYSKMSPPSRSVWYPGSSGFARQDSHSPQTLRLSRPFETCLPRTKEYHLLCVKSILSGSKLAQSLSHGNGIAATHSATQMVSSRRVHSGSRRIYERSLSGLSWGKDGMAMCGRCRGVVLDVTRHFSR